MFLTGVMLAPGVSAWSHEAEPSRAVSTRAVVQAAENETARFNEWLDAKYEEQHDFSPMSRGYAGQKKDSDKIDDMSAAAIPFPTFLVDSLCSPFGLLAVVCLAALGSCFPHFPFNRASFSARLSALKAYSALLAVERSGCGQVRSTLTGPRPRV